MHKRDTLPLTPPGRTLPLPLQRDSVLGLLRTGTEWYYLMKQKSIVWDQMMTPVCSSYHSRQKKHSEMPAIPPGKRHFDTGEYVFAKFTGYSSHDDLKHHFACPSCLEHFGAKHTTTFSMLRQPICLRKQHDSFRSRSEPVTLRGDPSSPLGSIASQHATPSAHEQSHDPRLRKQRKLMKQLTPIQQHERQINSDSVRKRSLPSTVGVSTSKCIVTFSSTNYLHAPNTPKCHEHMVNALEPIVRKLVEAFVKNSAIVDAVRSAKRPTLIHQSQIDFFSVQS
ncbi:uncharacterized protein BYT42DRAFT_585372 [Radiomyces spectabilis]|uniref:uncharacterized protein n=1 Tax=Radiomyces spectabilis TaxID=64574 RepID=UPI00222096D4|nr:uncharacterized protein BYT42DRAFT_585372 [Radiomyces spectabilis]KAI8368130.1 hypothetical protein BYT42DRAFT_585372 [Radiomyces spectabilis]